MKILIIFVFIALVSAQNLIEELLSAPRILNNKKDDGKKDNGKKDDD